MFDSVSLKCLLMMALHNELEHIDGLVQDCGNSSALAMELPQSCTKPLIYRYSED